GFFRIAEGSLEVRNCLFVETGVTGASASYGNWAAAGNVGEAVTTTFSTNYFSNCIAIWEGQYTDPSQVGATEADPGFEDPANGDFTVTNQTIIDNNVGDPRWHQ